MGLFDSIPTKVLKASPPQFQATADHAVDLVLLEDQDILQNAVTREAYAGVVLASLALVSHEVTNAWSASDLREITRLAQTASARLSPELKERATLRLRDVASLWNMNWNERGTEA
ncbi:MULTISPECIES: hypothetical protein [Brevundimonas]|uniref:hypothetical protein n=1 Tax=unclassified Brevundimonas TaxID=2622653 RepID=UPI000E9B67E3|nr:hypothetical protein [Brevundimonas sp.]HBI18901.1 hypothetical protein [Brevundimonas sp.]